MYCACAALPDAALPRAKRARVGCDLVCDNAREFDVSCCDKNLCGACVTNLLRVKCSIWYFNCPFCRKEQRMQEGIVKVLLAENCPHHAKALGDEGDVVVHLPDPDGHYACADSKLKVYKARDEREMEAARAFFHDRVHELELREEFLEREVRLYRRAIDTVSAARLDSVQFRMLETLAEIDYYRAHPEEAHRRLYTSASE